VREAVEDEAAFAVVVLDPVLDDLVRVRVRVGARARVRARVRVRVRVRLKG